MNKTPKEEPSPAKKGKTLLNEEKKESKKDYEGERPEDSGDGSVI